jgi:hypothetical protein
MENKISLTPKHGLLIRIAVIALFFTAECGETSYMMRIIDA